MSQRSVRERAMILDRFLSRSQLSTLAEERVGDWFDGMSVNFETEEKVQRRLASVITDTKTLQEDINSFEVKKPAFPWFLGEEYTVRWRDSRVEIVEENGIESMREEIEDEVERFCREHYEEHGDLSRFSNDVSDTSYRISVSGEEIIREVLDGVDAVSCTTSDGEEVLSSFSESRRRNLVSDLADVTGIAVADTGKRRSGERFLVAKEVAPVIKNKLNGIEIDHATEASYSDKDWDSDSRHLEPGDPTGDGGMIVEVTEAYPNDVGRGIIRLDPDALLQLRASPGDVIEIEGEEKTFAKAWRSDEGDWEEDKARIDGFTRRNADVSVGDSVTIRKADITDGERVVLGLPEGATVGFGSDASKTVKKQILKRPVSQDDVVPITPSLPLPDHPLMRSPGDSIPLRAVETEPDEMVLVTRETELELVEKT